MTKKMVYISDVWVPHLNAVGQQYTFELQDDLFETLINVCSREQLQMILETQISLELYETAQVVADTIDRRFGDKSIQ